MSATPKPGTQQASQSAPTPQPGQPQKPAPQPGAAPVIRDWAAI